MIKVRVPATSANVGIGFDCLGIAFDIYATFIFKKQEHLEIIGCDKAYANKDNLLFTSFQKAMDFLGEEPCNVSITIESDVPIARGLGSSATCVVAGILAAYGLSGKAVNKEEVLALATSIEGHPDNVAPAIYGKLQASTLINGCVEHIDYMVDTRYHFAVLIPNFETSTKEARQVLPSTLKFQEAVSNASKLPFLLHALETYKYEHLWELLDDYVHEPYRKNLIHEYEEVKQICQQRGCVGFYISGSGSTVVAIATNKEVLDNIEKDIQSLSYKWKLQHVHVDEKGAYIC